MPCIWLGHIGEYRLRPSRLGANTTFPRQPAASGDQDGIGPQSLRTQTVFPNMSSPDAWHSSNNLKQIDISFDKSIEEKPK